MKFTNYHFIYINSTTINIGKLAPDFVLVNRDNKKVALLITKVSLCYWSFSHHGETMSVRNPELVKVNKKFSQSGFEIVGGISTCNRLTWIQAIKNDKLTWPQLSDFNGQSNEAAALYNVNCTYKFFIDPRE